MDNQNEHIHPWAGRLNELQVPDVDESWAAMGTLLDAGMPVQPKKDRRRWALLLLLMLLLIGVCHFPQGTRTPVKAITAKDTARAQSAIAGSSRARHGSHTGKKDATEQASGRTGDGYVHETTPSEKTIAVQEKTKTVAAKTAVKHNNKKTGTKENLNPGPEIAPEPKENSERATKTTHAKRIDPQQDIASAHSQQQEARPIQESNASGPDTVIKNAGTPKAGANKENTLTAIPDTLKAGAKRTAPANQVKTDPAEDARGWAFALGLNQFFIVGDQEKSNFNSNGTSGNISDYIPVPAVRYYFHKWFYLQAEAQINSPQYTKTLLAGQGVKAAGFSGEAAVQSVFIKKLFYFNIPVSIHYSPVKNLFAGAGLQYSRLTNGVALFQDTRLSGGFGPNVVRAGDSTLIVSKVGNLKKDSAYRQLRTNEWRFLLDLNYQWNRLTIGVRYNQAFSDFINIHLSYLNISQAQNRSLQLYLRYMVLDRRRKFLIPAN